MATLTIRNIDEAVKSGLRIRAAQHGRSMEEEARQILRGALLHSAAGSGGLGAAIVRRFAATGGVDLPPPQRSLPRAQTAPGEDV